MARPPDPRYLGPCADCGVVRPLGPDGRCTLCAPPGEDPRLEVARTYARLRPRVVLHGVISALLLIGALALAIFGHSAATRAFAVGIVLVGVGNVSHAVRLYRRFSRPGAGSART